MGMFDYLVLTLHPEYIYTCLQPQHMQKIEYPESEGYYQIVNPVDIDYVQSTGVIKNTSYVTYNFPV